MIRRVSLALVVAVQLLVAPTSVLAGWLATGSAAGEQLCTCVHEPGAICPMRHSASSPGDSRANGARWCDRCDQSPDTLVPMLTNQIAILGSATFLVFLVAAGFALAAAGQPLFDGALVPVAPPPRG